MNCLGVLVICIDNFNFCLEKKKKAARKLQTSHLGSEKNIDRYKNWHLILFVSSQRQWSVLKKCKAPWKGGNKAPSFNRGLAALRIQTPSPWNYTVVYCKTHSPAIGDRRVYGQARRLEMHKRITKFIKRTWSRFCNPSSCFMFISNKFLEWTLTGWFVGSWERKPWPWRVTTDHWRRIESQ